MRLLSVEHALEALNSKKCSSEELLTQCFSKIHDRSGEGGRAFVRLFETEALEVAKAFDRARQQGLALPPFAGVPISVKDLFDLKGSVTTAGSKLLRNSAKANEDSLAVQRLRQAGFIIVGATNMTEFAYSGLGLNPHYGTPLNPFARAQGLIPGGSSSGAAVAVSDGFAAASIGTDTGGSCRIPAALCGLVGFKPTAVRIPRDGVYPLAPSLDAVGVIAKSVHSCALLSDVMAGREVQPITPIALSGLSLAMPKSFGFEGMDAGVDSAFERALQTLRAQGIAISELDLSELDNLPSINRHGGFAAYESYQLHREHLQHQADQFDPRVRGRILAGQGQTPDDYQVLKAARQTLQKRVAEKMRGIDALLMPTVPIIAPTLASLTDEQIYYKTNALMLRNPSLANFLDFCSISLPCHLQGQAPVGLMLLARGGEDEKLLSMAQRLEVVLAGVH